MKASHKEGSEMVRMHNKAAEYQEPEISTTFLKNAILRYVSQIPDNNKGSKPLLHSDIGILIWAKF